MAWQLTRWEKVKHQYFDFLSLVGLRDRLRCPKCKAVGTWKPHGGWCELTANWWVDYKSRLLPGVPYSTDRRWVCKWCGYVRSHVGEQQAYPNKAKRVWDAKCD